MLMISAITIHGKQHIFRKVIDRDVAYWVPARNTILIDVFLIFFRQIIIRRYGFILVYNLFFGEHFIRLLRENPSQNGRNVRKHQINTIFLIVIDILSEGLVERFHSRLFRNKLFQIAFQFLAVDLVGNRSICIINEVVYGQIRIPIVEINKVIMIFQYRPGLILVTDLLIILPAIHTRHPEYLRMKESLPVLCPNTHCRISDLVSERRKSNCQSIKSCP